MFRDHRIPCLGDPPCEVPRSVFVDKGVGGEWIWYDLEEVLRPVRASRLPEERDVSLAVRLLVSEIGYNRLVENRNALDEAVAILWTVDNRLRPDVYDPLRGPDLLEEAVDVAIRAFWIHREATSPDVTRGATSYVHRCGGEAYGEPPWPCDAHLGRPEYDVVGAEPYTGPAVFEAPAVFLADRGHYALRPTLQVDYDPL